jgi:hypothetical protein
MKKFLVIGLVGILCGLGAVSCGSDSPFDAKLTGPNDTDWGTVDRDTDFLTVPNALLFTLTTSDGKLPISGATIRFDAGDSLLGSYALLCASAWSGGICASPPGGASSIKMTTDSAGAARIYPLVHTTDCVTPTTTSGSLSGDTSIAASISAAFTLTHITYKVEC